MTHLQYRVGVLKKNELILTWNGSDEIYELIEFVYSNWRIIFFYWQSGFMKSMNALECTFPVTERVPIFTDIQKESKIVSVWTIFYVILNLCALSAMVWQKSARKIFELLLLLLLLLNCMDDAILLLCKQRKLWNAISKQRKSW